MLHRRDGARFPTDVTLGIQEIEFNLGFIRPDNLVSQGLRVFRCLFDKHQVGFHVCFTEDWLSFCHSTMIA